jgi:hypothetical protein
VLNTYVHAPFATSEFMSYTDRTEISRPAASLIHVIWARGVWVTVIIFASFVVAIVFAVRNILTECL